MPFLDGFPLCCLRPLGILKEIATAKNKRGEGGLGFYRFDTFARGGALENDEKSFIIRKRRGGDEGANVANFAGRIVFVFRRKSVTNVFYLSFLVH